MLSICGTIGFANADKSDMAGGQRVLNPATMALVPEIPRRQRNMVDTCFEEQLFDGGLGVLDRIRTPDAVPSQQHIRQLLYLALYSPVTDRKEVKKQVPKRNPRGQKQIGEIPPPERAVVDLALTTLFHFVRTNDARVILSSIPSYEASIEDEVNDTTSSRLAFHAESISRVKHCWEILSPNYILPEGCNPIPSKRSKLVADYAWGVFDWLVEAFEREAANEGGVSPTLLAQLPKSSGGPKVIINTPLDIIAASFAEPLDQRRIDSGTRLLALLVALTKTTPPLLSSDRLLGETCRRLESMSVPSFSTFLTRVDDLPFKCSLACAFIVQHSEVASTPALSTGTNNNRRQTTPQPPSLRISRGDSMRTSGVYGIPGVDRVLEIVRLNVRIQDDLAEDEEGEDISGVPNAGDQTFKHATMKLHLLGSIAGLKLVWQDESWRGAIKDGRVKKSIREGFEFGDGSDERLTAIGYTAVASGNAWLSSL